MGRVKYEDTVHYSDVLSSDYGRVRSPAMQMSFLVRTALSYIAYSSPELPPSSPSDSAPSSFLTTSESSIAASASALRLHETRTQRVSRKGRLSGVSALTRSEHARALHPGNPQIIVKRRVLWQQLLSSISVLVLYARVCARVEQRDDCPRSRLCVLDPDGKVQRRLAVELVARVHVQALVVEQQLEHLWRRAFHAASANVCRTDCLVSASVPCLRRLTWGLVLLLLLLLLRTLTRSVGLNS